MKLNETISELQLRLTHLIHSMSKELSMSTTQVVIFIQSLLSSDLKQLIISHKNQNFRHCPKKCVTRFTKF